ncbi:MAG: hypothetical protein JWR21_530 [Herminiimonas sp.]|nr:hypothetical protein [Herminiimonas sp.]
MLQCQTKLGTAASDESRLSIYGCLQKIRRPGGSNEPLGMGAGSTPMLNH